MIEMKQIKNEPSGEKVFKPIPSGSGVFGGSTPRAPKKTNAMTEARFNRTRFAEVMEFDSFIELDKHVQANQSFPDNCKVPTVSYWNGKKTNLLTAVVVYHLNKIEGWFASRQNSTGIPMKQGNGQIKWKPGGNAGAADIIAFGPGGIAYHYELKFGSDQLRPSQIKYRDKIQAMGGHYIVIRKYEDLLAHLDTITSRKINDLPKDMITIKTV